MAQVSSTAATKHCVIMAVALLLLVVWYSLLDFLDIGTLSEFLATLVSRTTRYT